ncbi:hypothetical protein D3C72_2466620 [compost metagenome]
MKPGCSATTAPMNGGLDSTVAGGTGSRSLSRAVRKALRTRESFDGMTQEYCNSSSMGTCLPPWIVSGWATKLSSSG